MDSDEDIGVLPTQDELKTEQEAKPEPAVEEVKEEVDEDDDEPIGLLPGETTIVVLKTQVGQERRVTEMLGNKARRFKIPIVSLLAPQELRGYVFIETTNIMAVEKGIRGVSYARSLIKDPSTLQPREAPFSEIAHFLTPVSAVAKIAENDIVELVSGPFRGEKAKVTRVDDTREEITVELIDSMVPIPITVKGENVRVLKKAE